MFWGDGANLGRWEAWNRGLGSLWGDGAVGRPMMMELWGMAHCGVMELWGMSRFGVMEPLWAGWGRGIIGMAGCGVMELWGVPP